MGCLGIVMIRIVVFTLFNSRISARVGNFNPLLCVGSSFLRIAFVGKKEYRSEISTVRICVFFRHATWQDLYDAVRDHFTRLRVIQKKLSVLKLHGFQHIELAALRV
jgi:hypothetical protein